MPEARQAIPPAEDEIPRILAEVHAAVRTRLRAGAALPADAGRTNPKGDRSYPFDLAADAAARRALEEGFGSGIVESEESGRSRFGRDPARLRFVLDPVDGSDNRARGLPLSALAVAVLPAADALVPARVRWAMVGGLEEPMPLLAMRGAGAYRGSERLATSGVRRLADALVSCELNHYAPTAPLARLLARARGVRSYGCASRALALVATGALDAHLDVRDRLTPESFLASALVLEEAGGCLVDLRGQPLGELRSLTHRTSLIAAASAALAEEILGVLRDS